MIWSENVRHDHYQFIEGYVPLLKDEVLIARVNVAKQLKSYIAFKHAIVAEMRQGHIKVGPFKS